MASLRRLLLTALLAAGAGAQESIPSILGLPARFPASSINTRAALSGVAFHRGLVIAPLGADHGGGKGAGALAVYDPADPARPRTVFDSRDHPERYHRRGGRDYLGDSSEYHHAILCGDRMILAERRPDGAGFMILDLAPLTDGDPATLPAVIGRATFPGVDRSTNYDGFSFALEWAGGRYVYAPTGSHGLFVYDTERMDRPELIAHLPNARLAGQVLRAAVAIGDVLVVSPVAVNIRGGKTLVLDISDPRQPTLLSTFPVAIGYQGFLYGSRFFNAATSSDGKAPAEILAWDLTDPTRVVEQHLGTFTGIKNAEYGFGKDGDLVVGHYPGALRLRLTPTGVVPVDRVEPQDPPGDDYAFISPVGGLLAVTSDHEVRSRLSFAPLHEPDRIGPTILHRRPVDGATGVARTTAIGIAFSDALDTARLDGSSLFLRRAGSPTPVPARLSHLMGTVNLVPDQPLAADATYEVVIDPARIQDQAGNPTTEPAVILRFATGPDLATYTVDPLPDQARAIGERATLRLNVLAPPGMPLEHAWDFGDGTQLPFARTTVVEHRFATPGNHRVTITSRRVGATDVTRRSAIQVVHRPATAALPRSSGTIALAGGGSRVAVVNPDHGTVACLETERLERLWEVPLEGGPAGGAAAVTVDGDGRWWVTGGDAVTVLDPADGRVLRRTDLGQGADPQGILVIRGQAYVACAGRDQIIELDAGTGHIRRTVSVPDPRHLAWDPVRDRLVAPAFLARGQAGGKVMIVDRRTLRVLATQELAASPGPDGGADGRGLPNYLAAPAIRPDGGLAWIPGKKDNLARGLRRDGEPLTFDHTVRSLAVAFDLERNREDLQRRIDFDNSDFATAAVFSPVGNLLFVATLGSRTIWAVEADSEQGERFSFDAGGEAPIGLAMAPDGRTLYVHHLLSRSVTAINVAGVVAGDGIVGSQHSGGTAGREVLPPAVLAGKRLFHDSSAQELSQEGYMSCASCHFAGGHDGRVWDLSQFGEGLRNTIDLRGKAGMGHGPLHWSGNFDEVQDFEGQIRALNQGSGLLHQHLLAAHGRAVEAADGDPKAGLSAPLDALAAYVSSLDRPVASPVRTPSGLSAAARRGRAHFLAIGCADCHRGPAFTDSAPGIRHDVGTLTEASGQRLGRPLDGLDTPTLLGLDRSAPYLHDGSAATLEEVLTVRNRDQRHGRTASLSSADRAELVAFLREMTSADAPTLAEVAPGQTRPSFDPAPSLVEMAVDARPGTVLGRFTARDADAGQQIRYRLAQGPDASRFQIDGQGYLTWQGRLPARQSVYHVVLQAEDNGPLPTPASLPVTIRVAWPAPRLVPATSASGAPELILTWLHLGNARRYRIEGAPGSDGPFTTLGHRSWDHGRIGTWCDHQFKRPDLRVVRVVAEVGTGEEPSTDLVGPSLPIP